MLKSPKATFRHRGFMELTEVDLDLSDDVHAALAVHQIDGEPSFTEAARAADAVKVRVVIGVSGQIHREVKIDHKGHLFHINSCQQSRVKQ